MGPPVDPSLTTRIVEFNDIPALEKALATKEIAAVLAEPAMTNRGIILPDEGFHKALRELTTKYGTLLIIDETHTISSGPGGYTLAHGLKPDMVTLGKPIGSGIPGAAYGVSKTVADMIVDQLKDDSTDENGLGGTLSGNAVALCAMKATLQNVITEEAYKYMFPLAGK
jgi:glutamate-1-semialdehyde 2,1-aminomutase